MFSILFDYHPAVKKPNLAFSAPGVARIVTDYANRGSVLVKLCKKRHHGFSVLGVEVSRGLILSRPHSPLSYPQNVSSGRRIPRILTF